MAACNAAMRAVFGSAPRGLAGRPPDGALRSAGDRQEVVPHRATSNTAHVDPPKSKLGFSGTWSMAVGGMIGGGIFSTLGVVAFL